MSRDSVYDEVAQMAHDEAERDLFYADLAGEIDWDEDLPSADEAQDWPLPEVPC